MRSSKLRAADNNETQSCYRAIAVSGLPAVELDGAAVRIGRRTVWSDVSMRMRRQPS